MMDVKEAKAKDVKEKNEVHGIVVDETGKVVSGAVSQEPVTEKVTIPGDSDSGSAEQHPLSGYTPTSKTIFEDRQQLCEVTSIQPVPQGMCMRESLGRLTVKGGDASRAADEYRKIKHLPPDWPVEVTRSDNGKAVETVILPR